MKQLGPAQPPAPRRRALASAKDKRQDRKPDLQTPRAPRTPTAGPKQQPSAMYETSVGTAPQVQQQFGSTKHTKHYLRQPEHGGQSALWWEASTKTSEKNNACPYKSIGGAAASSAGPVLGLERGRRQPSTDFSHCAAAKNANVYANRYGYA